MRVVLRRFIGMSLSVGLVACSTHNPFSVQDSAPAGVLDPNSIADAVPRRELITRAGNTSPYTVLGKTYHVMPTSKGYQEFGIASWYGTKFHGRPTANGEPYSLYGMTAAHRSLPIPSYVEVTNLQNGRKAIVRVNDRGPFHSERIIDLSYAAAVKLGFDHQGTTRVGIKAIYVEDLSPAVGQTDSDAGHRYFLQAGSFKSLNSAQNLRARLQSLTDETVRVEASSTVGFYRVRVGPLDSHDRVDQLTRLISGQGLPAPKLITE